MEMNKLKEISKRIYHAFEVTDVTRYGGRKTNDNELLRRLPEKELRTFRKELLALGVSQENAKHVFNYYSYMYVGHHKEYAENEDLLDYIFFDTGANSASSAYGKSTFVKTLLGSGSLDFVKVFNIPLKSMSATLLRYIVYSRDYISGESNMSITTANQLYAYVLSFFKYDGVADFIIQLANIKDEDTSGDNRGNGMLKCKALKQACRAFCNKRFSLLKIITTNVEFADGLSKRFETINDLSDFLYTDAIKYTISDAHINGILNTDHPALVCIINAIKSVTDSNIRIRRFEAITQLDGFGVNDLDIRDLSKLRREIGLIENWYTIEDINVLNMFEGKRTNLNISVSINIDGMRILSNYIMTFVREDEEDYSILKLANELDIADAIGEMVNYKHYQYSRDSVVDLFEDLADNNMDIRVIYENFANHYRSNSAEAILNSVLRIFYSNYPFCTQYDERINELHKYVNVGSKSIKDERKVKALESARRKKAEIKKAKEYEAIEVIRNFVDSNCNLILQFCDSYEITNNYFTRCSKVVAEADPALYEAYEKKLGRFSKDNMNHFKNNISDIVSKIADSDGNYTMYDWYVNDKMKIDLNSAVSKLSETSLPAYKKSTFRSWVAKMSSKMIPIKDKNIYEEKYEMMINGEIYEVTDEDKRAIISYMDENYIPKYLCLYYAIARAYLREGLDISLSA